MRFAVAFVSGLLFAVGLGLAGMTRPAKVIGFLDFTGGWDPSLGLVMASALAVAGTATLLSRRMGRPLLAERFVVTDRAAIDGRLVGGAAVFGLGWGLAGYCPGPAIVTLASGALPVVVFAGSMVAGILASRAIVRS